MHALPADCPVNSPPAACNWSRTSRPYWYFKEYQGFGLIFSPAKNSIWSSLGFTFFITVITIQIYHLVSGFWTLVNLSTFNASLIWSYTLPVFLADTNAQNVATYGNTTVGALKCALANAVAFAGIMGRGGLLPAVIITVLGTISYEINRQLISKYCLDFGGSIGIFCWGGVYGSMVSLIIYFRKHKNTAQQNEHRVGGKMSYTFVGIGALFCMVFFPFLNTDIPTNFVYNYQAGISCFYCMSASVLTCIGLCCLFVGKLDLKDFVYSPVVGGVIVGSSAALIRNSAGAVLLGIGAGIFHFLLSRW